MPKLVPVPSNSFVPTLLIRSPPLVHTHSLPLQLDHSAPIYPCQHDHLSVKLITNFDFKNWIEELCMANGIEYTSVTLSIQKFCLGIFD